LRIAFCTQLGPTRAAPEIASRIGEAAEIFRDLGADISEDAPDMDSASQIFEAIWLGAVKWRLRGLSPAEIEKLDPGLVELWERAQDSTLMNYLDKTQERARLAMGANLFHERHDLLLLPGLPIPAFEAGRNAPENSVFKTWDEWAGFCYPFNLTRQPAISIPCGFTSSGLPISLQIIGRRHEDATVLRAAAAFERIHPPVMPAAPVTPEKGRRPMPAAGA